MDACGLRMHDKIALRKVNGVGAFAKNRYYQNWDFILWIGAPKSPKNTLALIAAAVVNSGNAR